MFYLRNRKISLNYPWYHFVSGAMVNDYTLSNSVILSDVEV